MKNPPLRNPNLARAAHRIFAAALLFAAVSACALELNDWQNRQPLVLSRAGVTKFALPPETLDLARDALEDLRLIDPAGRETPFLLEQPAPAEPATTRPPASFRALLTDTATQLLIATGTTARLDALQLATPAAGFIKAARVELSADGETWTLVNPGAPVFRQFGAEQLRVALGKDFHEIRKRQ